jgi:hypothetical protein
MANKEKEQVVEQDPIVASVGAEEIISTETNEPEGVESSEVEVDWETEAKKFQSMYDKKVVEHDTLSHESKDLMQLRDVLNQKPELVDIIEENLAGKSSSEGSKEVPETFDPWDAYYKPESESYQYRVSQEKKLVHETVDNELAKLQNEMAMNNLQSELVAEHDMSKSEAQQFLNFATTPKANLPIETLINVWKESQGVTAKPNQNKKAVQAAKSVPKPAGVLQGGDQPQKSEKDQAWDRIVQAGSFGRLAKK